MDEKEPRNIYAIPANYTDSGKLFGGMLALRNTVETGLLLAVFGYPELTLLPLPGKYRVVVMTVTLLPLAVLSLIGVDGDSLFQYLGHIFRFFTHKRKLHCRRVGYLYDPRQLRKKAKHNGKEKKPAGKA